MQGLGGAGMHGQQPKSIEIEVNGGKQQIPLDPSFDASGEKIGTSELWSSFKNWLASIPERGGEADGAAVFTMKNLLDIEHPLGFTFIVGSTVMSILAIKGILEFIFSKSDDEPNRKDRSPKDKKSDPIVLRDFTVAQLREYNGTRAENGNKVYIALKRDVFDVSSARDTFYGPGQSYFCFAGREASRCMANFSIGDETDLAGGMDISDLGPFQLSQLDDWIQRFHMKGYPIVGRVSEPPSNIKFTREQLLPYDGFNESTKIEGRVNLPIYVGFNGKIYDVSYGGVGFYGSKESPYHIFAGKDATRGLSKMSLKPEDANSIDKSDFGENEYKTQTEWEVKFDKKYPIVGEIIEGETSSK